MPSVREKCFQEAAEEMREVVGPTPVGCTERLADHLIKVAEGDPIFGAFLDRECMSTQLRVEAILKMLGMGDVEVYEVALMEALALGSSLIVLWSAMKREMELRNLESTFGCRGKNDEA